MFPEKLDALLLNRKNENNLRRLSSYSKGIDFFSNDYLGIRKRATELPMPSYENTLGSGGSRLLSGTTETMLEVENQLATYYQSSASLLFSSGFLANVGLFSCLGTKSDTIIYDQHIHASTREGIRLSHAKSYSFKHNDYTDLGKKLKNATGDIFVAIEGVYSMDGSSPNSQWLLELQKKYSFYLIVDEAHAVGVLGQQGKGWSENYPKDYIFAKVITFGKALGFHGAIVTGSHQLKEYLVNFSKPFIYTTAPPESTFTTLLALHELVEKKFTQWIKPLQNNIEQYNKERNENELSPIKIVECQNIENVSKTLQAAQIHTKIIKHPTVEKGKEIIRICLHNYNTPLEMQTLFNILRNV